MLYHVECKLVQAGEPPLYNGVRYFVDQAIDYYPFGKVLREYILSGSSNTKYKSTGHERDKETSLDYRLARYYDSEIGRFLAVDPMKEKHLDHSPYSYCANNPILFLDPDGRDWYKDSEGHYRYNKDLNSVNSISILKKGETWLGFKYTEQTKNGTNEYRSDGSIFFGSQSDGVTYMVWATTKDGDSGGKQKEQFAFVNGNTMMVTPDLNNEALRSRPEESGYKVKDGTFYDPIDGTSKKYETTAHTHAPDKNYPNDDKPSGEDQLASIKMGYGFVLGIGSNNVYGYNSKGWFSTNLKVSDFKIGKKIPLYGKR
ncbi:MAG: RHS repeat-associated core domain-containing protein [Saprospiraceae bacterium]